MIRSISTGLFSLFLLLSFASPASAQDYEKEATEILKLYESGQKDTAYALVEPLKQSARFVPAAIYVRAQMTPDDRALNLYREILALEPNGPWADEAAYQLVRRYIDKRDSLAAWTWFGVLQRMSPQSPYVAGAESAMKDVDKWELEMPEAEEGTAGKDVAAARTGSTGSPGKPASSTSTGASSAPAVKEKTGEKTGEKSSSSSTSSTTKGTATAAGSSDFSGYALQVGLFPTKEAAEKRVKELEAGTLRPKIFPKEVDGKTRYALVVGPYKSLEEANKAKPAVAKACDCGAFAVKVE